jgi:hypothetical protein
MNNDAIRLVTVALKKRLEDALTAATIPGTVFVGPLDDADASGAKLILFLYRVVPSATLRNREHRVPSSNPAAPVDVYRNALPLDLYYLLTVGTMPGSSEETPLHSLGVAMQALQAETDLTIDQETMVVSLEPLTTEEASRIWALFPNADYRTSVAYLVTPIWIDPLLPDAVAARVTEDQLFAANKPREEAPS